MFSAALSKKSNREDQTPSPAEHPTKMTDTLLCELRMQGRIAVPLVAMNLTWFAKLSVTTAFLGRLGELQLAGGVLGLTFANVTGFSVLNGLCGAMEPICGQAFGASNFKLLHKSLLMTTILLLLTTLPIAFLWLNVDRILICFGQQQDISLVARSYLFYLMPDLIITSFLFPLKSYLSSQSLTLPIMFASAFALALHIPLNMLLSEAKGLQGISMAVWVSDLVLVVLLALYVLVRENRKGSRWSEGGWWDQKLRDWINLLKLVGPCCLSSCLEWWCYEILMLLTGRLPNAKQAVGVLAIVMNFDYLLYAVMLSLATCASTRVSNELGSNRAGLARYSAHVTLGLSVASGIVGALVMVATRGVWGSLFSHDKGTVRGVKKTMLLMALVEVVNFPLSVCGGIVRGTARPWLATYANLGGFYLVALPLGVIFAFKARLQLAGLLMGFVAGVTVCLLLMLMFVVRMNWVQEAGKAQALACRNDVVTVSENARLGSNPDNISQMADA
uniref:Protein DETOXIFICATION n=1 Tax=Kalanchoe fedtschenkoi TaxID=63787 RepID=A0A7N0TVL2_KALFE